MIKHPARTMDFDYLYEGLEQACAAKLVKKSVHPVSGLELFCYTQECVFTRTWDEITKLARGLILHPDSKTVVATPFPKFFNVGELGESVPDLPFEVFEKLDGSLIIIYHWGGQWHCATKGSFFSSQARWAEDKVRASHMAHSWFQSTFLAEAIYPDNRIVIRYEKPMLALLGGYWFDGTEFTSRDVEQIATSDFWGPFNGHYAHRHDFRHFSDLVLHTHGLPPDKEGYVVRFNNGHRLKIKGEAYLALHRAISHLTPLTVWEMLKNKHDLTAYKRDLPEEFWPDFDNILGILTTQRNRILREVDRAVGMLKECNDKQVGLRLKEFGPTVSKLIFPARKGKLTEGRAREVLYRTIRPTANRLEGYTPSGAVNRVQEES